jgi:hypothetical protein
MYNYLFYIFIMGKNTGNNTRKGAVKDRSQVYNEKTQMFIKRDATTGKFMSCSVNSYKGVTKEKPKIKESK